MTRYTSFHMAINAVMEVARALGNEHLSHQADMWMSTELLVVHVGEWHESITAIIPILDENYSISGDQCIGLISGFPIVIFPKEHRYAVHSPIQLEMS